MRNKPHFPSVEKTGHPGTMQRPRVERNSRRNRKMPARGAPASRVARQSRTLTLGPYHGKDPFELVKRPRVLFLDIETAPLASLHWGLWDQTVGLDQIQTEWSILSFAAKWLGRREVIQFDTGGRGPGKVRDDRAVLRELWRLLDAADIVVAQNGKAFDLPKINARLLLEGFPPYSPVKVVDTLLAAKRHFGFTSNKLAWLSKHLAPTKRKLEHREFPGILLWAECLRDNPRAWAVMRRYNVRDVRGLEPVYLKLRPWIEGHPNVAVYGEGNALSCPRCGCTKLARWGNAYTQTGQYQRYRCSKCRGFARSRYTENTPAKRRSLLSN